MYLCLNIDLNDNKKYFHAKKKNIYIYIYILRIDKHNNNNIQVIKLWKQQRSILLTPMKTIIKKHYAMYILKIKIDN